MKKIVISRLFLYRHRFVIGYLLLGLAFIALLFGLPLIAQYGISEAEMDSVTKSYALNIESPLTGDLVDLPYRSLQKASISLFGLTPYAIKLPSIVIGLILGLLLIVLLNRWFKNNVSLLASCLVILSTPFLFLAGSGTPLIMAVFWPTLLLWLGSKIHGEKKPRPIYSFFFALALLLAIFTPYMIYFALFCVLFVFSQPHLRFIVKSLPKIPLILVGILTLGGIAVLAMNVINRPDVIMELLFAKDFQFGNFFPNIVSGLVPLMAWQDGVKSVFLAPLVSLPLLALTLIGLFSTTRGFFASRNSIATLLIVFAFIITGFSPDMVVFLILPFAILIAHGLKYLLEKWYGLFPENPYARIAAMIPLTILFSIMLIPGLLQYIYGYRYNPGVANEFRYDLTILRNNIPDETLVVGEYYGFYKILEDSTNIKVLSSTDSPSLPDRFAVLYDIVENENYQLERIITSPMKENSDIIYLYTVKGEQYGSDNGPDEAFESAS